MSKTALVIRRGALGDVLLTTPITRRLKQDGYDVTIHTASPEAYINNPDIKEITPWGFGFSTHPFDKIIDLNLAYEKNPHMHIIDAYSMVAFGDKATPHEVVLNIPDNHNKGWNYIVVHASKSWENRTWPEEKWKTLLSRFSPSVVVIIGKGNDFPLSYYGTNYFDKSFIETCQLIKNAKLFIGMDSGMLHVAQALGTPAVGIFTCAKAQYRVHSKACFLVAPNIDCYGCLHDCPPPVTYCGCRRGDFKCLDLITPEMVYEACKQYL